MRQQQRRQKAISFGGIKAQRSGPTQTRPGGKQPTQPCPRRGKHYRPTAPAFRGQEKRGKIIGRQYPRHHPCQTRPMEEHRQLQVQSCAGGQFPQPEIGQKHRQRREAPGGIRWLKEPRSSRPQKHLGKVRIAVFHPHQKAAEPPRLPLRLPCCGVRQRHQHSQHKPVPQSPAARTQVSLHAPIIAQTSEAATPATPPTTPAPNPRRDPTARSATRPHACRRAA